MKKNYNPLLLILGIYLLTGCAQFVHHADPFYDFNANDFPLIHLPIIKPVEATQERSNSPWSLGPISGLYVELPKSEGKDIPTLYSYVTVQELEKFAVQDGVIMAYSAYVDKQADTYIQNNFYHWFVAVPGKNIQEGFHKEEDFQQFIHTLGIQNPNWQTPDEVFKSFADNGGCLEWIPDCQK